MKNHAARNWPQKALELHHKRKKLQVSWHTFAGVCFSQLVFLLFRIALPSLPNSSFQEICEGKHDFFEGQVCTIPNGSVRLNLVPFLFLGNVRACFKRNWNQLHDSPNPPKSQTHSEYGWIRLIPSVLSFCFFQSEFFHTNLVQLQHFTKRTYKLLNRFPACQPFPVMQPCACSLQASPLKPLRALPVGM